MIDYPSKILQIIPADGWYAKYQGDKEDVLHIKVICWALVDDGDENHVAGVDGDDCGVITFCSDSSNFIGYVYEPGCSKHIFRRDQETGALIG